MPFFLDSHASGFITLSPKTEKKSRQGENTRKGPKLFASKTEVEEGITHTHAHTSKAKNSLSRSPQGYKEIHLPSWPLPFPWGTAASPPTFCTTKATPPPFPLRAASLLPLLHVVPLTLGDPKAILRGWRPIRSERPSPAPLGPPSRDAAPKSYLPVNKVTAMRKQGAGHWAISCACPL